MDYSKPALLLLLLVLHRQGKPLRVKHKQHEINLYVYRANLLTNHENKLADLIHRVRALLAARLENLLPQ